MEALKPDIRTWQHTGPTGIYTVSTAVEMLDLEFINASYATEDMYWAKALPVEQLRLLLSTSETLGLYKTISASSATTQAQGTAHLKQIGMARFITDHVTTVYLTDVYITPEERKSGLGKWLIACCREFIDSVPALRRVVLIATPGQGQDFYGRELNLWDSIEEHEDLVLMTRRGFKAPKHAKDT